MAPGKYGDSGIFNAWPLAPEKKYCLIIIDYTILEEKKTLKIFTMQIGCWTVDKVSNFQMVKQFVENVPISWKRSSDGGLKIPSKVRKCKECPMLETKTYESFQKKSSQRERS